MTEPSNILKREVMAKGNWLELIKTHWQLEDGSVYHWEGVRRVGNRGCVMMIPRLKHSGDFILVEQFRPALGERTLEFPAGLVDEGESPQQAAIRELLEETGYHGKIIDFIPPRTLSPGLGTECIAIVYTEIDENAPENQNPTPSLERTEASLKVHRFTLEQLTSMMFSADHDGIQIEAKLSSFILGWALASRV